MHGRESAEELRNQMVREQIARRGIRAPLVLDAMSRVPRHEFVPGVSLQEAYGDFPLPIGNGQTISQPYMVALMTELLNLKGGERVLEIGTGSGYQTAILAEIAREVYTVERIPELLEQAMARLSRLGYENIVARAADGTLGWPLEGGFDGIIVTAAAPERPGPLVEQLDEGGRLVVPVGDRFIQELVVIERKGDDFVEEKHGGCRFVPLVGEHGWSENG